jgi:heterodisulfide reductase subunit A-like polyferredoxin
MAVARAAMLESQPMIDLPIQHTALVVGGGAAGMTAALSLASQGIPVHMVEKESELGGNLRRVFTTTNGVNPQTVLRQLVEQVQTDSKITIHLESQISATQGFLGNFTTTIRYSDGSDCEIEHGATILATGAQEYRGGDYGYGTSSHIVTQQEFEALLTSKVGVGDQISQSPVGQLPTAVVMIQCVGPAERFCSRICCTVAIKNALTLKELNPKAEIVILYRDIRTYGFKEQLYTNARERGVIFVRYDDDHHPQIKNTDGSFSIIAWDPSLQRPLELNPDLLVLSMPVVPNPDVRELSSLFKVPVDTDGFFLEAHVKLRPVDFSTDGVFMAGMAHYPKLLDETMIQAQAAAARAARVLSRKTLTAGGRVAVVNESLCTGCLTCVRVCPFSVPQISADLAGVGNILGAAHIEPAICQGCGSCAAECPGRAIQLMHYTDAQMTAKVGALVNPSMGFVASSEVITEKRLDG